MSFMSYAYLDKGSILHAVEKEEDAKQYSKNGKVEKIDYQCKGGYPLIAGQSVVMYSTEKAVVSNGEEYTKDGIPLDLKQYPQLLVLYKNLS